MGLKGLTDRFELGVDFGELTEEGCAAVAEGAEFGGLGGGERDGGACPTAAFEE